MMSGEGGDLPPSSGGKKKKKKRKMSAKDKAVAKLDKDADTLKRSGEPFLKFMDRMDKWLYHNAFRAKQLFVEIDEEETEVVSYDTFKAGMLDLGIPCMAVELHLLTMMLDPENDEEIRYLDLQDGLANVREREEMYTLPDIRPELTITERDFPHCPRCKLAIWDGECYKPKVIRYILVSLQLVTFQNNKTHPSHIEKLVHSHTTVYSLMQIIQRQTSIATTQIAIFEEPGDPTTILSADKSLEEYGFDGGTQDLPIEVTLYYDYKVEFTDCPLLICDHYFGQSLTK